MPDTDGSKRVLDGEVSTSSVELVPVSTPVHEVSKGRLARPDASFVTQLIATAELAPQTRNLRRGTPDEAQAAYGTRPVERRGVARRTRQII